MARAALLWWASLSPVANPLYTLQPFRAGKNTLAFPVLDPAVKLERQYDALAARCEDTRWNSDRSTHKTVLSALSSAEILESLVQKCTDLP